MDIFISYSHSDKPTALQLEAALSPFHSCWIDSVSIAAGRRWEEEIQRGIRNCEVFLFLVSEKSLSSPFCQEEVELALRLRKLVIPIMLGNYVLPEELARLQWVFLKENDFDAGINQLLGELSRLHYFPWHLIAIAEAGIILLLIGVLLGTHL